MRSFALIVASLAVQTLASPFVKRQPACSAPGGSYAIAQPTDPNAKMWLALHNAHRANHTDTCAMLWDPELAQIAQQSAQRCQFAHDIHGDYGQNIAEGYSSGPQGIISAAAQATGMWYNEIEHFSSYWGASDVPMTEPSVLHFTQMVWKETYAVGCAIAECGSMLMSFCNYRSAGNFAGNYAPNVAQVVPNPLPPICSETGSFGGGCMADPQIEQSYVF
ncbi:Allergen V5/Tpx-1-related protein [Neofusicoccum parvum]|uniref:Putative allergen v5 tpx-1-related protein n=1 Tax=Botryosphaeria parva (strain UCR-NP2) TaxID=1287680 RepID=R1GC35_BOTPV|nr:putative allergen v5 tpx-1-related protein [Neofusicoccum parvum UCRNP2]GME39222.1 Allergen V5/Tpx-1-related protein [Neofusicoccum parvum]